MQFVPYVYDIEKSKVPVSITEMTEEDAEKTNLEPRWQTSWTDDYISNYNFERYSVKSGDELIALGAYEILEQQLVVHIVYIEAQPESNPTFVNYSRKYTGIGKLLIAFGIKLSVDNGFAGDVVLEAKTTQLAKHYINDFGAVPLPTFGGGAQRLLIADEAAKNLFFCYLE